MELATTGSVEATIMSRLRDETAPDHKRAESSALEQALMAGTLPRAGFVALLAQRLCIHRVLERRLRELAGRDARVAEIVRAEQAQEANLADDLRFFGVDPVAVTALPTTRALTAGMERAGDETPAALLGFLYVFEGSKNGARHMARRIRAAYGLEGAEGLRYLDPHGEAQRPVWAAFKARMDAATFSGAEQDAMLAAAKRAFDGVAAIGDEIVRTLAS